MHGGMRKENEMAEHLPEGELKQRSMIFPLIFMSLGIMVLGYCAFIFVFGVGLGTTIRYSNGDMSGYAPSPLTSLLRLVAQPALAIGLGLLLIGLGNKTKNHSLGRRRSTVTILGMILISIGVLVALLMIFAVLIGSALFP